MLEQLRIFTKVYEQRNFTKAAELLFISQPTLSVKIKQLEQQLNVTLFIRQGPKNSIPTEAAHIFYDYALQTLDTYEQTIAKMQRDERMRCTIGCSHTIAVHYFPIILPKLAMQFPMIDFSLSLRNSEQVAEAVTQHSLMIGLIEKPIDTHPLAKKTVATDELVLAGQSTSQHWLMREPSSGVRFFNELYRAEHNSTTPLIEVDNNEMIIALLQQGFGKSILSKASLPKHIPYETLPSRYKRELYVIYHEQQLLTPVVQAIIAAFATIKNS